MTSPFAGWPRKRFGLAIVDCPWAFRTYGGADTTPSRTAEDPYPVMSLQDLKNLPVSEIMADDSILLMWTVSHLQDEATEVAEAWGFKAKSVAFIWDKGKIGMGYWVRQEAEICKLYTRGRPKRLNADVRQMIRAPRREHSRKPDEQYARAERLAAGPYVELFARQHRPGWTSWGNEAGKFDAANSIHDHGHHGHQVDVSGLITLEDLQILGYTDGLEDLLG